MRADDELDRTGLHYRLVDCGEGLSICREWSKQWARGIVSREEEEDMLEGMGKADRGAGRVRLVSMVREW